VIKLKKIVCILIFSIVFAINGNTAIKDSIFATVGDRAVTRSDIINEIKLILILNGQEYSEAIKEKLDNSAVQSVIKRTIKKIEIEKHGYLRFSQSELDEKLKHVAYNVDMTLDTLKQTLVTNGLEYSSIVDQIKTDLLWKSLIFSLYKERLSINVEEITDQLKTIDEKKEIKEYLISEIVIKPVASKDLENTIKEIKNDIKNRGFETVALEKSISESAIKGGDLGWINENSISKDFKLKIENTPTGEISEAIFLPQGILFFEVRDKKSLEQKIDLEDLKNKLVHAEKNKILNMYSLSHYDKLRRMITVVYY